MTLEQFFKKLDASFGIPRSCDALHLDYYQAGLRFTNDLGGGLLHLVTALASCYVWLKIIEMFHRVDIDLRVYIPIFFIMAGFALLIDIGRISLPYYQMTHSVTHGSARWADVKKLKSEKMLVEKDELLPKGALRIGKIKGKYNLILPYDRVLRHTAIFGPPGSGKSSSFYMGMAKDWSVRGSAVFLDPKGELYRYTAKHFKKVYRLDLANPKYSDKWNFVPNCKGDAELANEIASIIVGFDPNKESNFDPFWPRAETALMTALLLHLPQIIENANPSHIAEFIAVRGFEQINYEMRESPDPEARVQWGIFKKADQEKTQGGVFVGLGTKIAPLRSPHAMSVLQSLGPYDLEEGMREINLYDLRKPGTAIYVVIPEGDASRYRVILSILFGLVSSITRKTSDNEAGAPILLALDEAGNIPMPGLSETLGVGRGRKCGLVLGYQNVGQLYKQHGRDAAQAILGSIGTMIFLPGLDSETCQFASKCIGRTTVEQHRSVDGNRKSYLNQGQNETGRDLMDSTEVRQMPEYMMGIAIIGTMPPVRFTFPDFSKTGKETDCTEHKLSVPLTLDEAESATAIRKAIAEAEQEKMQENLKRVVDAIKRSDIQYIDQQSNKNLPENKEVEIA